ncbi:MAG: type II toxin-antitoxin system RelE/ParE family toxin [Thermoanaerobaculia bacterium]
MLREAQARLRRRPSRLLHHAREGQAREKRVHCARPAKSASTRRGFRLPPDARRAITRDFPYSVFYAIDTPVRVVVLRVIHHAQDPTEWPTTT